MLSETTFNEFCDDLTRMSQKVATPTHRNYKIRTSSDYDFVLSFDSSTIALAFFKSFSSAADRMRTGNWGSCHIIEFKLHTFEDSHPIFTREWRIAAYEMVFDNLAKIMKFETLEETIHDEPMIPLVQAYFHDLKQRFSTSVVYPEKNEILIKLRRFILDCHNPAKYATLSQLLGGHTPAAAIPTHTEKPEGSRDRASILALIESQATMWSLNAEDPSRMGFDFNQQSLSS